MMLLLVLQLASVSPDLPCMPGELAPTVRAAGDQFGHSVALDGERAAIGAPGERGDTGAVHVFRRRGSAWSEEAVLTLSSARPGDRFGHAVALLGERLLVGSPARDEAHVFERDAAGWRLVASLRAEGLAPGGLFGDSVALGADQAWVGAPGADEAGLDAGAVASFVRDADGWHPRGLRFPGARGEHDHFGSALASDGKRLLVGAWGDSDETSYLGATHVFETSRASWSHTAKLVAGDGPTSYYFGDAVGLSGARAIIGAWGDDDQGVLSGSAYVYRYTDHGWAPETKLTAHDGSELSFFGWSVAIAGDTAVVGAYRDAAGGATAGAAYVFRFAGGAWREVQKLVPPTGEAYGYFGYAVAAAGDTALIGAHLEDAGAVDAGAVHLVSLSGAACAPRR